MTPLEFWNVQLHRFFEILANAKTEVDAQFARDNIANTLDFIVRECDSGRIKFK